MSLVLFYWNGRRRMADWDLVRTSGMGRQETVATT